MSEIRPPAASRLTGVRPCRSSPTAETLKSARPAFAAAIAGGAGTPDLLSPARLRSVAKLAAAAVCVVQAAGVAPLGRKMPLLSCHRLQAGLFPAYGPIDAAGCPGVGGGAVRD